MTTWTNTSKNTSSWTNQNKSSGGALIWTDASDTWTAATYSWDATANMGSSTVWSALPKN